MLESVVKSVDLDAMLPGVARSSDFLKGKSTNVGKGGARSPREE